MSTWKEEKETWNLRQRSANTEGVPVPLGVGYRGCTGLVAQSFRVSGPPPIFVIHYPPHSRLSDLILFCKLP
jgi:hypothetical protein